MYSNPSNKPPTCPHPRPPRTSPRLRRTHDQTWKAPGKNQIQNSKNRKLTSRTLLSESRRLTTMVGLVDPSIMATAGANPAFASAMHGAFSFVCDTFEIAYDAAINQSYPDNHDHSPSTCVFASPSTSADKSTGNKLLSMMCYSNQMGEISEIHQPAADPSVQRTRCSPSTPSPCAPTTCRSRTR